jgi:hypothetical protein
MTLIKPPSTSRGPRPPEDLDGLLRAFFQAEMPDPWPASPAPRPAERNGTILPFRSPALPSFRKPTRGWSLFRTRLALAASVALLALGAFCLPGAFRDGGSKAPPAFVGDPGANEKYRDPGYTPPGPPKKAPSEVKFDESLIREPTGEVKSIRVDVIEVPAHPK